LIDAVKACACLLIVGHHLAFYGPMSDVVAAAWPTAMDWLYAHGRLAVQFFLVCAGFLTAGSLSRFESLGWDQALHLAWQRYLRLAIPLLAALTFTLGVTEGLRPYFAHASLSATPDLWQALAHLLLLQDVLDLEALSAGIWYVAQILRLETVSSVLTPSTWTVQTDRGRTQFMLKGEEDIRRLTGTVLLINDANGVQYMIRDLATMDKHSRKLLDRFL